MQDPQHKEQKQPPAVDVIMPVPSMDAAIDVMVDKLARRLSERAKMPPGGEHITLRMIWEDYRLTRRLRPVTARNYRQRLSYLSDWMDLPAREITKDMVEEKHQSLPGDATANGVFRVLRSLYKFAAAKYVNSSGEYVLPESPTDRLTAVKAWRPDHRKISHLSVQQLPHWFKAVYSLESSTTRDFLLLCLFTGLRSGEAKSLRWRQVDLQSGVIKLFDTKNGDDAIIPLSDFVWNMLGIRSFSRTSEFVFPGSQGSNHYQAGSKSYRAVTTRCGIKFSPHDLRRTFCTIADEIEIKHGVLKALMNHRSSDITDSYTIRSTERLRRASQAITDTILHYAGMYWLTSAKKSIQSLAFVPQAMQHRRG